MIEIVPYLRRQNRRVLTALPRPNAPRRAVDRPALWRQHWTSRWERRRTPCSVAKRTQSSTVASATMTASEQDRPNGDTATAQ